MIEGMVATPLKKICNGKGDIFHIIKKSSLGYKGFGEVYISMVNKKQIKGWKKHLRMQLNFVVPFGEVKIVLYDDREDSSTFGECYETILSRDNYIRLTIPPGILVAFQGGEGSDNMLINVANIEHDPEESITYPIQHIQYEWER